MQDNIDSGLEEQGQDKELEESKINELEIDVAQTNLVRKLIFFFIIFCMVFGLYYLFTPQTEEKLTDPLNALSYESLAMEEDQSGERLYLPSQDKLEIDQYFENTPDLDFKPRSLVQVGQDWTPEGASIIDYEVAKIAVVQYAKQPQNAKIFFFTLFGSLKDLENTEEGDEQGFSYRPYASDQLNMVVWQDSPSTLAVLVGRLSIKELAKIAKLGSNNS